MLNRREALLKFWNVIIAVGASTFLSFDELLAMDESGKLKPNIVWLHASSCSGCSTSFLNIENVSVVDFLTKFTNVVYHPDVSLATGHQVADILERVSSGDMEYLLVLEGAIPVKLPHACMMADKPMTYWVDKLARNSVANVTAGTCAAFGGITNMDGMLTGSTSLDEFQKLKNIKKPVINLPNCPLKPEHLLYVVLHYAKFKTLPELDGKGRPKRFYDRTVHDRCIYYSEYQEKSFAKKVGDRGCLYELGCQGPVTYNDCLVIGHNGNTNTCIKAGHPCIGCASEHFPRQIMYRSHDDKRVIKNFKIKV